MKQAELIEMRIENSKEPLLQRNAILSKLMFANRYKFVMNLFTENRV